MNILSHQSKTQLLKILIKKHKVKSIIETISYMTSITDDLSKNNEVYIKLIDILNEHVRLINSIFFYEKGYIFNRETSNFQINQFILCPLMSVSPLYAIRICNEIIEEDVNDLIREMIEDENQSIDKDLKKKIILLRDDYKTVIPNEIITENIEEFKKSLTYKTQDYMIKGIRLLL